MDFKEQLSKLRSGLPAGNEKQPPPVAVPSSAQLPQQPRVSARVRPERAGRAPYNFVPLPETSKIVEGPPDLDSYTHLSGEIEIRLTALTPFFIRGMLPLDAGKEVKEQTMPYSIDGEQTLRLPGSTLRGMTRALVEILGMSPIDPVNDHQLFFRAVASSDNPRFANSFEPQATAYRQLIGSQGENVRAGYLTATPGGWMIEPAKNVDDRTFFKYGCFENWTTRAITFEPGTPRASSPGSHKGVLVCSGPIQKKRSQWIITEKDPNAKPIKIRPEDVEAYLDGGRTQGIKQPTFLYDAKSKDAPCFFVQSKEEDGSMRTSFGHTPFFRVPYRNTTRKAIPPDQRQDSDVWDLAQAIFGRIRGQSGMRGRVRFEDAILENHPEPFWSNVPPEVVLGSPKPTTYQHYLVQPDDDVTRSIQWDGDLRNNQTVGPVIRGHKLYWHRQEAVRDIRRAEQSQSKVMTRWRVPNAGGIFTARIHYENLRDFELGALLEALDLPRGCAHKLGMGKPLGLGSFRIEVAAHRAIDRKSRYSAFVAAGALHAGETAASDGCRAAFRMQFYPHTNAIWDDPRLKELKALLTYDGHLPNWAARTRYLEFGRVSGRTVNEYLIPSKRRPLPPATQVLTDATLPDDPRPDFEKARPDH